MPRRLRSVRTLSPTRARNNGRSSVFPADIGAAGGGEIGLLMDPSVNCIIMHYHKGVVKVRRPRRVRLWPLGGAAKAPARTVSDMEETGMDEQRRPYNAATDFVDANV